MTTHDEPSELERAQRFADRVAEQSARSAMVKGATAQLKLDERWAEGKSVLLNNPDPVVRDIGRFLEEGVPPSVAYWLVMNDRTKAGQAGVKLDSETVDAIVSQVSLAIDARLALLDVDMELLKLAMADAVTKRDLIQIMAELRKEADPVLLIQRFGRLKRALEELGIIPASTLPPKALSPGGIWPQL